MAKLTLPTVRRVEHRSGAPPWLVFGSAGAFAGVLVFFVAGATPGPIASAVGLPLLVLGGVAILRDWRIGLVVVAATLPLAGVSAPGTSTSVVRVIVLVTLISAMFEATADNALRARLSQAVHSRLAVALIAYVGWVGLSVLWAPRSDLWLTQFVTTVGFVALIGLTAIADRRTVVRMWIALLIAGVAAIPLASMFDRSAAFISEFDRLSIGGGDPNEMAALLAITIGLTLGRDRLSPATRILSAIGVLVLAIAIVLTGSRSGLIALGAVVAGSVVISALGGFREPGGRSSQRVGGTAFAWMGAALLLFLGTVVAIDRIDIGVDLPGLAATGSERMASLADLDSGVDLSGRLEIWDVMLDSVRGHPVIGVGAGNAETVSAAARVFRASDRTRGAVAHNTLLQSVVELGVVGVALYILVWAVAVAYIVQLALRRDRLWVPVALAMVAWVVAGLALNLHDQKVAALLLGSVLALRLDESADVGEEVRVA